MTSPPQHAAQRPARTWHRFLLIPLTALFVIHPLAVHGCSCGHDFDFHLLSWMEAARQLGQGILHPHWAYTPAFNAGEPRFVFYPPLSWYLGALLGLLLTHLPGVSEAAAWNATPILFTWIALTLSGFTLDRLARAFATEDAALLAAVLYLANPYMLFTAFERTAYSELLAAAWIPLLLLAILRERVTVPRIALPVALLWLTNAPAAVMGCYALALLALVRMARDWGKSQPRLGSPEEVVVEARDLCASSSMQVALKSVAGTALGLGISAFYIVPVAYERHLVQLFMATIAGMRIDRNFLFEHTGVSPDDLLHDQVLHTASLIAVILLTATALALAATAVRRKRGGTASGFPLLPLAVLTAGIGFLLTPLSTAIWNHAPEAAFLQFPWRLLAILASVFALATATALGPRGDRSYPTESRWTMGYRPSAQAIAVLILAAVLALPAYHVFRQPCDPEDTATARLALFHSNAGTDATDEYTLATADNDALKANNPPFALSDSPQAAAPADAHPGLAPMHFRVTVPRAEFLILNLRDYPAWRVFLNGALDSTRDPRADGLIALPIPAGASAVDIRYAQTPDQTLGDTISVLALAVFCFALPTQRKLL